MYQFTLNASAQYTSVAPRESYGQGDVAVLRTFSKSRRDGLFIDRAPSTLVFLFVFQRRGLVRSDELEAVPRAAEKQKECGVGGPLIYKQVIPTGLRGTALPALGGSP